MRKIIPIIFLSAFCMGVSAQTEMITMKTLLEEMTDRSTLAQFPDPYYVCRQASSYSRETKTRETAENDALFKPESGRDWGKGWYENHDFSQYIRTEEHLGRTEDVMFEDEGPGCIVRFWATFGGLANTYGGIYRVYIDGDPNPVIEMYNKNLVGKDGLIGKPFSFHAPEKAENDTWRGSNLILPIPYQKSCKITFDGEHKYNHISGWHGHYYQINYRSYEAGTQVESFTKESLVKYSDAIQEKGKLLMTQSQSTGELISKSGVYLSPGEKITLEIEGQKAITELVFQLQAEHQEQALRSTVMSISFDGKQTVWCPIGQFFGVGYKPYPHHTFYISSDSTGRMVSKWVMPFSKRARVTFENLGDQWIQVLQCDLRSEDYSWNQQSMYFHAAWKQTRHQQSEIRQDYNYVKISGKGVFVGDNLTIFNSFPDSSGINWWGEGDEKIFVDGEAFPSHIGTGTEDYYSYAWCRPQAFSAPNVSQPCGEGNKTPGHTSNNRYRLLDAIPFQKDFEFDMEIWHPYRAEMLYSPATFWYAFNGAESNAKPDPDGAREKVVLTVEDF